MDYSASNVVTVDARLREAGLIVDRIDRVLRGRSLNKKPKIDHDKIRECRNLMNETLRLFKAVIVFSKVDVECFYTNSFFKPRMLGGRVLIDGKKKIEIGGDTIQHMLGCGLLGKKRNRFFPKKPCLLLSMELVQMEPKFIRRMFGTLTPSVAKLLGIEHALIKIT